MEGRVVNGGVSPNWGSVPTRGHLPEKSMLPKVFEGNFEEWRNWRDDVSDFLDTRNLGMLRPADQRLTQAVAICRASWMMKSRALKGLTGDKNRDKNRGHVGQ